MAETRKLVAILAADIAGYSRLASADEDRTLARLRALRGDLIDPAIGANHGRVVKQTGDGLLIEFRSVVDVNIQRAVTQAESSRKFCLVRQVVDAGEAAQGQVLRIEIARVQSPHAGSIDCDLYLHRARQAYDDLILHLQEVAALGVELIGPQMRAGFRVDELGIHPYLIAAVLFAPLQHIADAEVWPICFTSTLLPL